MTLLPIVERELRVAARKASSFWVRVAAALVAVVLGAGCLVFTSVGPFSSRAPGGFLFGVLTWIGLAAVLAAGLFFTSDCISEEKREGTLGFLFLTDLRGYDVIAGKLLATSLRGFYAVLAIFPILATTLLMGGVTGVEFWKTALALLNALICSLAVGLFVSTISRDSQKALAGTLLLLLLITLGGPAGDGIWAATHRRPFQPLWSLLSPAFVFKMAGAWGRTPYWKALALTQITAWFLLAFACWLAPRTWQQRARQLISTPATWAYFWKFGGPRRRLGLRRKLLERDAMLWLACRERWQALGMWLLAIVIVAGLGLMLRIPYEAWMVAGWVGSVLTLVGYLWMSSQAGRFFIDARQSGLIELLLATPLTERQIVNGQWKGLARLFGAPVVVLLAVQLISGFLTEVSIRGIMSQVSGAAASAAISATNTTRTARAGRGAVTRSARTNAGGPQAASTNYMVTIRPSRPSGLPFNWQASAGDIVFALLLASAATVATAANLIALCWFGMWMGMTSKTAHMATLKTILFAQIVPHLVIGFASAMIPALVMIPRFIAGGRGGPFNMGPFMTWYPALIAAFSTLLSIAKDTGFVLWSRKQLYFRFREQASRSVGQGTSPPPLPETVRKPPIIASTSLGAPGAR